MLIGLPLIPQLFMHQSQQTQNVLFLGGNLVGLFEIEKGFAVVGVVVGFVTELQQELATADKDFNQLLVDGVELRQVNRASAGGAWEPELPDLGKDKDDKEGDRCQRGSQ